MTYSKSSQILARLRIPHGSNTDCWAPTSLSDSVGLQWDPKFAFSMSSQVWLMLLVPDHTLQTTAVKQRD